MSTDELKREYKAFVKFGFRHVVAYRDGDSVGWFITKSDAEVFKYSQVVPENYQVLGKDDLE